MARTILIPGAGHVTETGDRQYLIPGHGHFTDTFDAGGGVVEGTGSAVGTSTVTALATAFVLGVASAAGVGTATAQSLVTISTVADSDGVGAASGVSATVIPTTGSVSALAVATGQGAAVVGSLGSSTGISVVTGISEAGIVPTEGTGAAVGTSTVTGLSGSVVGSIASSVGLSVVTGIPSLENFVEGVGSSAGTATANALSQTFHGAVANASGVADSDFITGVVAGVVFGASGTATVLGQSPPSLVPGNFKPIEQRRIRLPKLPRGLAPEQWIDISTREFDSFFNDMHHYLAANTFVSGVHTEILEESFTLTPETSTIFLMSNGPVSSDPVTAIKNVTNVPRIFIVVNTGLFPVTFRDGANTVFAGGDIVLQSGRLMFLVYTGAAWVGNAL